MSVAPPGPHGTLGPVLVFGKNGQVGSALQKLLSASAVMVGRDVADFTKPDSLLRFLGQKNPSVVINAVAYNAVDRAETEKDLAFQVNGMTPGMVARWCSDHGKTFVHYSTDYVFNGEGSTPWTEESPTAPLSIYGESKLEGERQVAANISGGRFLIFRTSWVYDSVHSNFVTRMAQLAREKPELKIVSDQWGSPTYAPDIAATTLQALERGAAREVFPSGIYHLCNSGYTHFHEYFMTFYDYLKQHGVEFQANKIIPVTLDTFPTPARRPKNGRMNCNKLFKTFDLRLPFWKDSLVNCLDLILKNLKRPTS